MWMLKCKGNFNIIDCCSVMKCDAAIRKSLLSCVVISGGSARLPGIAQRLQRELQSLASPDVSVKVTSTQKYGRSHSAWIGGVYTSATRFTYGETTDMTGSLLKYIYIVYFLLLIVYCVCFCRVCRSLYSHT